ncbi:MAG: hydrolase [Bacteroidetes bacterium]|nr:MAG: hydrolase [Bacteroidota bacterium]
MILRHIFFIALLGICTTSLWAQKSLPSIRIEKTSETIRIDGRLDEGVWKNMSKASDFYISTPMDTAFAKTKTEVMITYDDKNLYVAAICYDDLPGENIIQSLKRDFSYPRSDAFSVVIDPFNDKTNGFSFAVNPKGVQREGLIQGGGSRGVTTAWDNLWYSAVTQLGDRWFVEMAIPFNSIRFKEGGTEWSINFTRNDLKRNESSSWASVPRNFNIATLNYCGKLIWDKPLEKPKKYVAIIPYLSGGLSKDYEGSTDVEPVANGGVDAKIAISSTLQLDLTVNPDFSQVEVDRQQTNLSRFSLFFPERRNFFIENSDLFAGFGFRQIRPFFSRRIGLKSGAIVPILGGVRLSGKVGDDWRIGIMNMQTDGSSAGPAQNFSVAAVQRQVFKSSNISLIGVNRSSFKDGEFIKSDFNRMIGSDFNFASSDRKHNGKVFFHKSFSQNKKPNDYAHASWYTYSTGNLKADWNHEYVGENYNALVGFVPRIDRYNPILDSVERKTYWRLEPALRYRFFPKESKHIIYHGPYLYLNRYTDSEFKLRDNLFRSGYTAQFSNTSTLGFFVDQEFTHLFFDTDVTFTGDSVISGGDYKYINFGGEFVSNQRKPLYAEARFKLGEYYNGTRSNVNLALNYRWQPIGIFGLDYNYNSIDMPHLKEKVDISLIGATAELSFTRSIFFTTFFQYNTQSDNFNINSRLQWRFRPLSDFYLVYSENYEATDLDVKNRALVLKLIYWFQ